MKAVLVRRHHPKNEQWEIVDEKIPVGTEYEVFGFSRNFVLENPKFGTEIVDCLLVSRGAEPRGWMPLHCFELRE